MTVGELRARMTAAEIAEWAAYLDVVAAEKRQAHAEAELAARSRRAAGR